MTLYDSITGTTISTRDITSSIDANGNLSLELQPSEMIILGNVHEELHILLLEWTWNAGSRSGKHEIHFFVKNFSKIT